MDLQTNREQPLAFGQRSLPETIHSKIKNGRRGQTTRRFTLIFLIGKTSSIFGRHGRHERMTREKAIKEIRQACIADDCIGGVVVFIATIFVMRGRWSPAAARADEAAHDAAVARELHTLQGS